ncbi:MAG TPA: 2-keto-4-pentenoate hydratase [Casimicrobiaceae bacterium]|nr:2-keto-4-pentenoate hydratase [Casimicrobiaceae bacterium]
MAAATESAARFLIDARRERRAGGRLPEGIRPGDVDAALAIQQRVTELLALPIGGWKCSLPVPERPVAVAPIYAPTIFASSPCPILPIAGKARIEPEIAFVMDGDLPPRAARYDEAEVRAAIGEPRLVLELIGPRYADPAALSFPEILADGINNQGLFAGPVVPDALERSLSEMPIAIDAGSTSLHAVQGRHPDGHPLMPLTWLANFLAQRQGGLRAGQIVTTGSYCGVVDVPLNTQMRVRFGTLGALTVEFASAP